MELSTKASGQKTDFVTAEVFKFGKMVQNTKDNGMMTNEVVKEQKRMQMVQNTRDNSKMGKKMAKGH